MKGSIDSESDHIEVKNDGDSLDQLFYAARTNDVSTLKKLLENDKNDGYERIQIDTRNESGCTALHLAAINNNITATCCLLNHGASISIQDYENAWTPLHRAFYKGHVRIALMLLTSGATLGDNINNNNSNNMVSKRPIRGRSIKNIDTWKSPIDHDGYTPLDLLTWKLSNANSCSYANSNCSIEEVEVEEGAFTIDTLVLSFGKADFQLGIPLPKQQADVQKPRCLEDLPSNVVKMSANRHHSMALCDDGAVLTWGHGQGGKLGHGDEHTQPLPKLVDASILSERKVKVIAIAAGEDHSLALSENGRVFAWGSDKHGQLGLGSRRATTPATTTDLLSSSSSLSVVDSSINVTSPLLVSGLRRTRVRGIAAGGRHSICFSETAVFTWGSNLSGQLGLSQRSAEHTICIPRMVSLPTSSIISVAAGPESSVVLLHREEDAGDRREVYQWGQGIQLPMRVPFSNRRRNSICESNGNTANVDLNIFRSFDQGNRRPVELIQISSGRSFNCALSAAGHVYLWITGSISTCTDTKEREREKDRERNEGTEYCNSMTNSNHSNNSNNSNYVNTNTNINMNLAHPQVLESLFPENGGGKAISIDAASERACVVMENGDLYTFDVPATATATASNSKLPVPRRVIGIKCAESVAAGDHHTLALTSLQVPPLPHQAKIAILNSEPLVTMLDESQTNVQKIAAVDTSLDMGPEASFTEVEIETDTDLSMSMDTDIDIHVLDVDPPDDNEPTDHDGQVLLNAELESTSHVLTQSEAEIEIDSFNQTADDTGMTISNNTIEISNGDAKGVSPLSLKELCENRLAQEVTVRNSPRLLDFANTYEAHALTAFCEKFIKSNLDAVLVICKRSDLELLIADIPLTRVESSPPGTDSFLSATTISASSSGSKQQGLMQDRRRYRSQSQSLGESEEKMPISMSMLPLTCSDITPTKSKNNGSNSNHIFATPPIPQRARANSKDQTSYEGVVRTIKSVKKKLHAIDALEKRVQEEGENNLQNDQLEKIRRKKSLEEQLHQLEPLLDKLALNDTEATGDEVKATITVVKQIDYARDSNEAYRVVMLKEQKKKVKEEKKKEYKDSASTNTTTGVPNFSAWLKMADATPATATAVTTTISTNTATTKDTASYKSSPNESGLCINDSPTLQEALLIGRSDIKSRQESSDYKNTSGRSLPPRSSWAITPTESTSNSKSNNVSLSSILLEQKEEKQEKQLSEKVLWNATPTKTSSSSSSSLRTPPVHMSMSLSISPGKSKKQKNDSGGGHSSKFSKADNKATTASMSWGSYLEQSEEMQKQRQHDILKAKCPWGSKPFNTSKEREISLAGNIIKNPSNNHSIGNSYGVSMASILEEEEALRVRKNLNGPDNGHSNPWKTGLIALGSSPYEGSKWPTGSRRNMSMENIFKMEEEKASTAPAAAPTIDLSVNTKVNNNNNKRNNNYNIKNKKNTEEKNIQIVKTETKKHTKINSNNNNNNNNNNNKNNNNINKNKKNNNINDINNNNNNNNNKKRPPQHKPSVNPATKQKE